MIEMHVGRVYRFFYREGYNYNIFVKGGVETFLCLCTKSAVNLVLDAQEAPCLLLIYGTTLV